MKFNINDISRLFLLSVMLCASSCNNFLEEKDPANLNPADYYQTAEHAEAAINAVYDNTRFLHNSVGIFAQNWQLLEMPTGLAITETGQNQNLNTLNTLSYNSDNLFLNLWWSNLYLGIGNANLAISKIPGTQQLDAAHKTKLLGEAKFLRAWFYFYLVRLWGDVPLITEPILEVSSPNMYPSRASKESVYDQIIQDLLAAENSGLPWADPSGRVSLGAVKSVLASVYLTMAGYPLNKGTEYYEMAAAKAKEVIDNGPFTLFNNYDALHDPSTENTMEHIFMIQYVAGINEAPYQQLLLPNFKEISAYSDEIGSTVPTIEFFHSYEAGDKRIEERQFYFTQYYDGGKGELKPLGGPYIYKFFDKTAHGFKGTDGTAKSGLNWPLIRYAEVLLTYAEAQNEVTGPTEEVIIALKQIRDRAGLGSPTVGEVDKGTLRKVILKEKWHELAYEGKTWFDMIRLKKAYDPVKDEFVDFVGYSFSYGTYTLEEKHLLFPLPTEELKNNPNLKSQNKGWE